VEQAPDPARVLKHTRDFKKDGHGQLIPLDLIVHRLPEGSDLHDILTAPLA
jgi:hypothetical protein